MVMFRQSCGQVDRIAYARSAKPTASCRRGGWVTRANTGLEPGTFQNKYYARGVGFILGVEPETGESVQLVGCNFDPRCAALPMR